MIDTYVNVELRVSSFRDLAIRVTSLPKRFRPIYFTVGERVRDKSKARVDDSERFAAFIDGHVERVSGFDLIGERIRFGIYVGATRNARHESTHVGCSVILRGRKWKPVDFLELLKALCSIPGVELADTCRRDEWNYRHSYKKQFAKFSVQGTLGRDISAFLPGLYWWTVFSDELIARHGLDVSELTAFAGHAERWGTITGSGLRAFRLYNSPDDWEHETDRISAFLERHGNFFSMTRIGRLIEGAKSEEVFDEIVRPYRAGFNPWEKMARSS